MGSGFEPLAPHRDITAPPAHQHTTRQHSPHLRKHCGHGPADGPAGRGAGRPFIPIRGWNSPRHQTKMGASARRGDALWRPGPLARTTAPPPLCPPSPQPDTCWDGWKADTNRWRVDRRRRLRSGVAPAVDLHFGEPARGRYRLLRCAHSYATGGSAAPGGGTGRPAGRDSHRRADHPAAKSGPQTVARRGQERLTERNSPAPDATGGSGPDLTAVSDD